MQIRIRRVLPLIMMILAVGCDDRATRVALQSVDQQARQNLSMAEVNEHIAAGTKQLVAADADARRELLAAHRELQVDRSELAAQWQELEQQRRQLIDIRRRESLLLPLAHAAGGFLLVVAVLGFCWYALASARAPSGDDKHLEEILVEEIIGDSPRLLSAARPINRPLQIGSHDAQEVTC